MKKLFSVFILFLCLVICVPVFAAKITLVWDGTLTNGTYRIYQTMIPHVYCFGDGNEVASTVAGITKCTINDIPPGRYCFVVTAVTAEGQESGPSNEVCITLPGPPHDADLNSLGGGDPNLTVESAGE